MEHSTYRYEIDVVCLKIKKSELEKFEFNILEKYSNFHPNYIPEVMNDIHVIGYPWGIKGGDEVLPIYKKGSIASEPNVNYGSLPRFLIDCRTTSGMSGSPVIASRSGFLNGSIGSFSSFAGVYSGRLKAKSNMNECQEITEIGIVWRNYVISEIVNNGNLGTPFNAI